MAMPRGGGKRTITVNPGGIARGLAVANAITIRATARASAVLGLG